MKVAKINGNRDRMDVYFEDGRVARFVGEMLADGFVAFMSSLKNWQDGKPITDEEKREIIDAINERQKISKVKIYLED